MSDEFYQLPSEKIAQVPPKRRGDARLLVLHRDRKQLEDKHYTDLIEYLTLGDVLILNNTKVIPARIRAYLDNGRIRELMLVEKHQLQLPDNQAQVIYRGTLEVGSRLRVGLDKLRVIRVLGGGQAIIEADRSVLKIIAAHGMTPLPPYIRRTVQPEDQERYQTVFASQAGSVAAPTASLNMTIDLLEQIKRRGVVIAYLSLHVGRGTFLPIRSKHLNEHRMHQELFEIPMVTLSQLRTARRAGHRLIALGTTTARAMEYAAPQILDDSIQVIRDEADIFIYPGYRFQMIDGLLTNFHAPNSTVIQLAAAFAGPEILKQAYSHALSSDYQFLSYGDSMLIL